MFIATEIILYVANQERSKIFYEQLLGLKPVLDVPGMTEFALSDTCKLGLMPEQNIAKILLHKTPHPASGNGIPRCELYLYVDNINEYYSAAKKMNAAIIDEASVRDWGDKACYFADPDGHIIAFAQRI
jgi:catechol 2,3-dioxygenase-like lactoylglutathione lyase family enzyme